MKDVSTHIEDCLAVVDQLPPLDVSLADAVGCVLAADALSVVDVPPLDLAARDGYAVRAEDLSAATSTHPVALPVIADIEAGVDSMSVLTPRTAIRLSSGAPLPRGADAVVALDDTDHGRADVTVSTRVNVGDNIRVQAEDLESGLVALSQGTRIGPRQVALLAAAGLASVPVHPAPRVVVMSIGDELVEPGRSGAPGSVYDANSHGIASAARDAGGVVFRVSAVADEKRRLREALQDQLVRADLIITTGGLSYGGGDTVKEVLGPLGTVRFDRIGLAPGRQCGVGTLAMEGDEGSGIPIFCLPGIPAAALIGFELFVRPALRKMAGYTHVHRRSVRAQSVTGWKSPADMAQYVPIRVVGSPSKGYRFEPTGDLDKELIFGLSRANALAVIPAEARTVAVGDWVDCLIID